MKSPLLLGLTFFILFFCKNLAAQTDPVRLLPDFDKLSIEGEAVLFTEKFKVVVGGRHCNADPEIEACDFNAHLLVIERAGQRVWEVPLFNLPPDVADHFSAVGLCATSDDGGMAYVAGGYGYDDAVGTFSTLGQMTVFPLEKTIAVLLAGNRADENFLITKDPKLAVFDGRLLKIGDWFMLFDGHRTQPVFEENAAWPPKMNETDYDGELRTWRLECGSLKSCEVADYQVCDHDKALFQCMPKTFYLDEKKRPVLDIDLKDR